MTKKAVRKARRSGTKSCDVSGETGRLVRHHISGRDIPGAEKPWNIAWVTPDVHDRIHCGDIVIEGWVMTTKGRQLMWHVRGGAPVFPVPSPAPNGYAGTQEHSRS